MLNELTSVEIRQSKHSISTFKFFVYLCLPYRPGFERIMAEIKNPIASQSRTFPTLTQITSSVYKIGILKNNTSFIHEGIKILGIRIISNTTK